MKRTCEFHKVADPDTEVRWGPTSPDPEIKRCPAIEKNFRPFGGGVPWAPPLDPPLSYIYNFQF